MLLRTSSRFCEQDLHAISIWNNEESFPLLFILFQNMTHAIRNCYPAFLSSHHLRSKAKRFRLLFFGHVLNAGLAPSIRCGSVKLTGPCIDIFIEPFIVCIDNSPAAARSSAKTPSPAPFSPWQAAQFCAYRQRLPIFKCFLCGVRLPEIGDYIPALGLCERGVP